MGSSEFGSSAWADQVFMSAPARKVKGRTRWTHRHAVWVDQLRRLAYVESRNELIGLLALDHLHRRKLVNRFKEQPFTTDEAEFGYAYTPDFIAESSSLQRYVIEVKTDRFISRALEAELDTRKRQFEERGLTYLVWTDHRPLVRSLRHNLLMLRRASALLFEPDEIGRLREELSRQGSVPLRALQERELDVDLIAHACWNGTAFISLVQPISEETLVSSIPMDDLAASLFNTPPDLHGFWNSLEDAA